MFTNVSCAKVKIMFQIFYLIVFEVIVDTKGWLGFLNDMRYINSRFTYLLFTYLHYLLVIF